MEKPFHKWQSMWSIYKDPLLLPQRQPKRSRFHKANETKLISPLEKWWKNKHPNPFLNIPAISKLTLQCNTSSSTKETIRDVIKKFFNIFSSNKNVTTKKKDYSFKQNKKGTYQVLRKKKWKNGIYEWSNHFLSSW